MAAHLTTSAAVNASFLPQCTQCPTCDQNTVVAQAAAAAQDVSQLAAQTLAQLRLVGPAAAQAAGAAGPLRAAVAGIVTTSMAQRVRSGGASAERRKGAALVDAAQTLLPPAALQVCCHSVSPGHLSHTRRCCSATAVVCRGVCTKTRVSNPAPGHAADNGSRLFRIC